LKTRRVVPGFAEQRRAAEARRAAGRREPGAECRGPA
jgi:hypothetical protein